MYKSTTPIPSPITGAGDDAAAHMQSCNYLFYYSANLFSDHLYLWFFVSFFVSLFILFLFKTRLLLQLFVYSSIVYLFMYLI